MKVKCFALCVLLLFALAIPCLAQMDQDQQMDENQPMQSDQQMQTQETQQMTATVQTGPVVRSGLPASADVFVNGRFAMRIPASAGGMTPMERARIIAGRLNKAFSEGMSWNDTRVNQVGSYWIVSIGNTPIATADSRSARAYNISPGALASRWATQTVVALGGQPSMIASQLQPVPAAVAGAQQQIGAPQPTGAVNWTTATTKMVPLIRASDNTNFGNVMVGGPQSQLDMVNAVAVFMSTREGAMVWTFVPIAGTEVSGQVRRIPNVGLLSVPSGLVPLTQFRTGADIMQMTTEMGTSWNSMINSTLTQRQLQLQAPTKIVPIYSTDTNQVVGAAQVVGTGQGVAQTQMVIVTTAGDMLRFSATAAQCPPTGQAAALDNVVVSSIILFPKQVPAPSTTAPGTTAPESSTETPAAPDTGEMP